MRSESLCFSTPPLILRLPWHISYQDNFTNKPLSNNMATPDEVPVTDQDEIQFDHAEFATDAGAEQEHVTRCSVCTTAIEVVFLRLAARSSVPATVIGIESAIPPGLTPGPRHQSLRLRLDRRRAFGAILYYAIIKISNWNIGLVAVVMGLMVGGAVKAGSGEPRRQVLPVPCRVPDLFGDCSNAHPGNL